MGGNASLAAAAQCGTAGVLSAMEGQRDEVFFFVIERPTGIAELMKQLYVAPDEATQAHFLHVNAHIDRHRIRAGQLVVVTPARWAAMRPPTATGSAALVKYCARSKSSTFERTTDTAA